jgi:glucose/arabinose dehydrogenase
VPDHAPYCEPRAGTELSLTLVARGLDRPVGLAAPPGDSRLFAIEQSGRIRVIVDGELQPEPYLDISDRVISVGPEQGLLGLAFHPDFARNGRFVIQYTAEPDGDNVVAELFTDPDALVAAPSEREILHIDREVNIHTGGSVLFGPHGYLYVSIGDGSHAVPADFLGAGQDPNNLLAKVLRLDLESGTPYAIPPDNPWAGGGGAPEVYAWGLRNPWRISVDPVTGDLWIGDVGQNTFEEINMMPGDRSGLNFGWSVNEGPDCWVSPIGGGGPGACGDPEALVAPIVAIDRRRENACAVIGGHVYRGGCMPDLVGRYLFSDFCNGVLKSISVADGVVVDMRRYNLDGILAGQITSFGVDGYGEIYAVAINGRIYRIELETEETEPVIDTLAPA